MGERFIWLEFDPFAVALSVEAKSRVWQLVDGNKRLDEGFLAAVIASLKLLLLRSPGLRLPRSLISHVERERSTYCRILKIPQTERRQEK